MLLLYERFLSLPELGLQYLHHRLTDEPVCYCIYSISTELYEVVRCTKVTICLIIIPFISVVIEGRTDCQVLNTLITAVNMHERSDITEIYTVQSVVCTYFNISALSSLCLSAVTDDSDNGSPPVCREASPEVTRSHDVSESSPGSEPTGLNHSAEERDSANCVDEPETAALADMSERSAGSEFAHQNKTLVYTNCELVCVCFLIASL